MIDVGESSNECQLFVGSGKMIDYIDDVEEQQQHEKVRSVVPHSKLLRIVAIIGAAFVICIGGAFAFGLVPHSMSSIKLPSLNVTALFKKKPTETSASTKSTAKLKAKEPHNTLAITLSEQLRENVATAAIAKCADPALVSHEDFNDAQKTIAQCTDSVFKAAAASQLATYAENFSQYTRSLAAASAAQKAAAAKVASTTNTSATQAQATAKAASKAESKSSTTAKVWVPPVYRSVYHAAVYTTENVPAVYTTVNVPAVYTTVQVPATTEQVAYWVTSNGQTFDTSSACATYMKAEIAKGVALTSTVKYKTVSVPATTKQVLKTAATTKQVLKTAAYYSQELVSAGYWK